MILGNILYHCYPEIYYSFHDGVISEDTYATNLLCYLDFFSNALLSKPQSKHDLFHALIVLCFSFRQFRHRKNNYHPMGQSSEKHYRQVAAGLHQNIYGRI